MQDAVRKTAPSAAQGAATFGAGDVERDEAHGPTASGAGELPPAPDELPPADKAPAEWTTSELLAFMRENAPAGLDVQAMLPVIKRAIADGFDPRQMVPVMRGAHAAGVPPEQMLAMAVGGAVAGGLAAGAPPAVFGGGDAVSLADEGDGSAASAAGRGPLARFGRDRVKKALVIVFWLAAWEVADRLIHNRLVLTGPIRTLQELVEQAPQLDFWAICGASFLRIAAGFFLAFAVGILLALAAYKLHIVRDFVDPIISLLKTVPMVSFIIMLLIWVGNQALTIWLAFLIVVPLIYTNMFAGLSAADPKLLEMARVFRLSAFKRFMYVYRPAFMPFLHSGCKIALGMSWKSGIMAEVFGLPAVSIGRKMFTAKTFLDTPELFAWTVMVMLLSVLFEKAVMALLDRAARPCGAFLGGRGAEDAVDPTALLGQPRTTVEPVAVASVSKSFGDHLVLDRVSLDLEPDRVYCLMAPSGSGKTTLLRIVLGLERADAGNVEGVRPGALSAMFQEDRLCEVLTPVENVLLACPDARTSREEVRALLAEVLPEACLAQPVSELSGGMRRRVSLVRAVACPAPLVVFDEPFTGLDTDTKGNVIAFLTRHREGRILLVSTHGERDAELLGASVIGLVGPNGTVDVEGGLR